MSRSRSDANRGCFFNVGRRQWPHQPEQTLVVCLFVAHNGPGSNPGRRLCEEKQKITHLYPCFTTTEEINVAQQKFPDQDLFVICPRTHLHLGTLETLVADFIAFAGGHPALLIV